MRARHLQPRIVPTLLLTVPLLLMQAVVPPAAHSSAPGPAEPWTPRAFELALGSNDRPADVDGDLVVGYWFPDEYQTGFVLDLTAASPTPRSLGTLGGAYSSASAIDDGLVVGAATLAGDLETHAFAVDLSRPDPVMLDLGTLGGTVSGARGVDGTVVVGSSTTASGDTHAFAYDLAAPVPRMVDLGTLGGSRSVAVAVSGGRIVGSSTTATGETHAFLFELPVTDGKMVDLGTLGGVTSEAHAIDGDRVVGSARTSSGASHAFLYDLGAVFPRMRDLGTLGGASSVAYGISGDVVVGGAGGADGLGHPVAMDLGAFEPAWVSLGAEAGSTRAGLAVDGTRVVGYSREVGTTPMTTVLWTLGPPSVHRTSTTTTAVDEAAGETRVELTRSGDLSHATTVGYATADGSATAGADYVATSGRVRFEPGQATASVVVPVRDDPAAEPAETFTLTVTDPSVTAEIGTPSATTVHIAASDQQPDAMIGLRAGGPFRGDGIYNRTGAGQTSTVKALRGGTAAFSVVVGHDGNEAGTFVLRGPRTLKGTSVSYWVGRRDVTARVSSADGHAVTLAPGGRVTVALRAAVPRRAAAGTTTAVRLTATWSGDPAMTDTVRAVVLVRR